MAQNIYWFGYPRNSERSWLMPWGLTPYRVHSHQEQRKFKLPLVSAKSKFIFPVQGDIRPTYFAVAWSPLYTANLNFIGSYVF
jgi:hypothetical protein